MSTETLSSVSRRNFIKAASTLPAAGACLYTLSNVGPLQCALVGVGWQGEKLIQHTDPKYLTIASLFDSKPIDIQYKRVIERCRLTFNHTPKIYNQYEDVLNDSEIEAVIIATPTFTHGELAIQALKAGKHVFVERMMAATPDQCHKMVALAEEKNLILQVGHPQFYSPVFWGARHIISTGLLGNVYHCRIVMNSTIIEDKKGNKHFMCLDRELIDWQLDPNQSYGLWSELCPDWLSWMNGLFPRHKPIAVQAHSQKSISNDAINIDTNINAMIEYENNLTLIIASLHNWEIIEYDYMQIMGTWGSLLIFYNRNDNEYKLIYRSEPEYVSRKEYTLYMDYIKENPDGSLITITGGTYKWLVTNVPTLSNLNYQNQIQLKNFAHSIKTGFPIISDGAIGLSIANTCYAAHQAAQTYERTLIET